jgi:putative hemolysin
LAGLFVKYRLLSDKAPTNFLPISCCFYKKLALLLQKRFLNKAMAEDTLFLIDIDKILREKAPKKYKYIPRFLVAYLKKIVHQEELNVFLRASKDEVGVGFLKASLDFLDTTLHIVGAENLPTEGLCTFVSNHPLGGQDGLALGYILGTHYEGKVKYLVNDLLMNLHGLAPLCIPINKTGKQGRNFPMMVEEGFRSDNQLIMFPAGLCSRRHKGVIRDIKWSKTFITKSVAFQRNVVPIYFEGRNSDFFYRLANMCKSLGIKFNIAMLYLADEMLKNRHKTFTVVIGKPIPWQTFDHSKSPAEWAQFVQDEVYKLSLYKR